MSKAASIFEALPSAQVLHWLVQGNLASSMNRAVRFWAILGKIYKDFQFPEVFRYPDLRDLLYSQNHPTSDKLKSAAFANGCGDRNCICHYSVKDWLNPTSEWLNELQLLTGFNEQKLSKELSQLPFATVHRSIRSDLEKLAQLGWLKSSVKGEFQTLPTHLLPQPPTEMNLRSQHITQNPNFNPLNFQTLSRQQRIDLLVALETLSVVQPNLEFLLDALSELMMAESEGNHHLGSEFRQTLPHTFVNLDYILPPEVQDRVDDYHKQLEDLWHTSSSGVIQFDYEVIEKEVTDPSKNLQPTKFKFYSLIKKITVYPVCIHYLRRAKYLSAYGINPDGRIGWHNYRLDRIASPRLKILPWGDSAVPKHLKQLRNSGKLPTSQEVDMELRKAWGFKFYDEPQLLLIRFSADFARWYVDNTVRHPTFKPIAHSRIAPLLQKAVSSSTEQNIILSILEQRDPKDCYYQALIRPDDINIIQRLRDWRPNGEILAPISLRQRMLEEATQELMHYLPLPST